MTEKKGIFGKINFADATGGADIDEIKKELKNLSKLLKDKDNELKNVKNEKKEAEDKISQLSDDFKTFKTEIESTKEESENKIKELQDTMNSKDEILGGYKRKERLEPIQKWFNEQKEDVKTMIENKIVDMDDDDYKLFIAGKDTYKNDKEGVGADGNSDSPNSDGEIPNINAIKAGGSGKDDKEEDGEKPKPLEEIYSNIDDSGFEGYDIIQRKLKEFTQ